MNIKWTSYWDKQLTHFVEICLFDFSAVSEELRKLGLLNVTAKDCRTRFSALTRSTSFEDLDENNESKEEVDSDTDIDVAALLESDEEDNTNKKNVDLPSDATVKKTEIDFDSFINQVIGRPFGRLDSDHSLETEGPVDIPDFRKSGADREVLGSSSSSDNLTSPSTRCLSNGTRASSLIRDSETLQRMRENVEQRLKGANAPVSSTNLDDVFKSILYSLGGPETGSLSNSIHAPTRSSFASSSELTEVDSYLRDIELGDRSSTQERGYSSSLSPVQSRPDSPHPTVIASVTESFFQQVAAWENTPDIRPLPPSLLRAPAAAAPAVDNDADSSALWENILAEAQLPALPSAQEAEAVIAQMSARLQTQRTGHISTRNGLEDLEMKQNSAPHSPSVHSPEAKSGSSTPRSGVVSPRSNASSVGGGMADVLAYLLSVSRLHSDSAAIPVSQENGVDRGASSRSVDLSSVVPARNELHGAQLMRDIVSIVLPEALPLPDSPPAHVDDTLLHRSASDIAMNLSFSSQLQEEERRTLEADSADLNITFTPPTPPVPSRSSARAVEAANTRQPHFSEEDEEKEEVEKEVFDTEEFSEHNMSRHPLKELMQRRRVEVEAQLAREVQLEEARRKKLHNDLGIENEEFSSDDRLNTALVAKLRANSSMLAGSFASGAPAKPYLPVDVPQPLLSSSTAKSASNIPNTGSSSITEFPGTVRTVRPQHIAEEEVIGELEDESTGFTTLISRKTRLVSRKNLPAELQPPANV